MIPVAMPQLVGNEVQYVTDCLRRGQLSMGDYVKRFEALLAETCGVSYALTCCNGTSALHLALLALEVKPEDEVLVPALTYVATANAVHYCGAKPIFCDVEPGTWSISVEDAKRQITEHTVGIIPVHLYGVPCDLMDLEDLCKDEGLWMVEDAAEAIGATHYGEAIGSFGSIGVLSFYGNKIVTCGEGGAVVTDDEKLVERMKLFRGQGVRSAGRYDHELVGYNYRMGELQAAVGLAQLEKLDWHLNRRHEVCKAYREWAAAIGLEQQTLRQNTESADWMFTFLVPSGFRRDVIGMELQKAGVQTRPAFPLVPRMPMYRDEIEYPVSTDVAKRGLTLPTYAGLTLEDQKVVCEQVQGALQCVTR